MSIYCLSKLVDDNYRGNTAVRIVDIDHQTAVSDQGSPFNITRLGDIQATSCRVDSKGNLGNSAHHQNAFINREQACMHIFIRSAALVIATLLLAGCANPIKGSLEPRIAADNCYKELPAPFTSDGHIYTTLTVTELAGLDDKRQINISFFSQYPDIDLDYEATPVAIKYLLPPRNLQWRNDVTGKQHSLHGGGRSGIDERRKSLRQAISTVINDESKDWMSGLLIHAFGDTYAHTAGKFGSDEEKAYGVWIGHALPTLFLQSPDKIKLNPNNTAKYLGYVDDLYRTLKTNDSMDWKLTKYKTSVESLDCSGKKCANFHTVIYKEPSEQDKRVDSFTACMKKSMRQLTVPEVQSVMDMMKGP